MLTQKDIDNFYQKREELAQVQGRIDNRIEQIVKLISETLGFTFQCYYYPNAAEGQMGELDIDKNEVTYIMENAGTKAYTKNWDFSCGIPTDFLFMTDTEIIIALASGNY
jgi:hypothetical protein